MNGFIKDERPESIIGAREKGANHNSLGVCVVGHFDKEWPNPSQINSVVEILSRWCVENKIDQTKIYGHFEVPGGTTTTDCPGSRLKSQLNSIKTRVKENIEKKILNYV